MSETINNNQVFSLFEVTKSIQNTLLDRYKSAFWIKAEMNKLNHYKYSGHCYPELVEKKDGKIIAQIKSNLWKDDYITINNKFLQVLKEPLKDGIKILFLAKISFDPEHGLALRIIDIDPSYTLGDLEKEKLETINKLKEEGIFSKNKSLSIPLLPQRIAIISVDTSKGYADFQKIIDTNPWKYSFFHFLFPSLLQGDKAVENIIYQLNRIKKLRHHFDIVVIIRGGGGDIGLSCFNNYLLTKEIAMFPIPVLTGIGHATNETVIEMVSYFNAITPSKLADYLLQCFHNYSVPVHKALKSISEHAVRIIKDEKLKFNSEIKIFRSVTDNILIQNKEHINLFTFSIKKDLSVFFKSFKSNIQQNMNRTIRGSKVFVDSNRNELVFHKQRISEKILLFLQNKKTTITNLEKNVHNMDPNIVLQRGYSITYLQNKAVKSFKEIKDGDIVKTIFYEGQIKSVVTSSSNNNQEQ